MPGIDAFEHCGREQRLEGARHRKAFVAAMAKPPAGCGVVHGEAHASAAGLLGGADGGIKVETPGRRRGGQQQGQGGDNAAAIDHRKAIAVIG